MKGIRIWSRFGSKRDQASMGDEPMGKVEKTTSLRSVRAIGELSIESIRFYLRFERSDSEA
ncbi:hypothetical protein TorRG33x02_034680 [Trema orientale]|uniref:Uncharacterized protein n=1 Tax=Trema orientale TaxID=63057 RepID=A0A2P5FSR9_TREOI|nr:hypothetical protein TorRG33x02_034680 [Trema orientale]